MESKNKLKRGLSTRHIRFMALGSAIGTGLFYGSADAIKMAGPSVLDVYKRQRTYPDVVNDIDGVSGSVAGY